MNKQEKQQVRIYLRPQALQVVSDLSKLINRNLSETIEACIAAGHLPIKKANGAIKYDIENKYQHTT